MWFTGLKTSTNIACVPGSTSDAKDLISKRAWHARGEQRDVDDVLYSQSSHTAVGYCGRRS